MTKHTPGPWVVIAHSEAGNHPNHAFRFVGTSNFDEDSSTGEIVARLTDSPAIAANAHLLAAAPDMAEALRTLKPLVECLYAEALAKTEFRTMICDAGTSALQIIDAAIAKAKAE